MGEKSDGDGKSLRRQLTGDQNPEKQKEIAAGGEKVKQTLTDTHRQKVGHDRHLHHSECERRCLDAVTTVTFSSHVPRTHRCISALFSMDQ